MNCLARSFLAALVILSISGCRVGVNASRPDGRDQEISVPPDPNLPPSSSTSMAPASSGTSMADEWNIPMSMGPNSARRNHALVTVLFATDRKEIRGISENPQFGSDRSEIFTFGECEVSIPKNHHMGKLETPSIWSFELKEDPNKHVILQKTRIKSSGDFFSDLRNRISKSKRHSTFIFVHGYNVTFSDAARRTAQIAYDLRFDGVPVFYSWPSKGETSAYIADRNMIEWAEPGLRMFLEEYITNSGADDIYVIAHSMGNWALTRALADLLTKRPYLSHKLKEIILAAPDIDAGVFRRDIAPAMAASGVPVTLYASSNDKALMFSERLNAFPRAGESGSRLLVIPGVETIDASSVRTDFMNHSYFAESKSVISDIFNIIRNQKSANDRFGLVPKDSPNGRYWIIAE